MSDTATMPVSFQFGFALPGAALPLTKRVALENCTVRKIPTRVEPNEARGTLSYPKEAVSDGPYTISGSITLVPRPDELVYILPMIFGGTFAATVLTPATIVDEFWFGFDRKVKVYNSEGMKVARAVFSSRAGQQLRLRMDLEGRIENVANAGTFPSLSLSTQTTLIHHQVVGNVVAATPRKLDDIEITIDNGLTLDRFYGSQTRTELPQGDRRITVGFLNPFTTSELDEYNIALAGMEADFTWTNGGTSLKFEFPSLQASPETPGMEDKRREMQLRMLMDAKTTVGHAIADEIKITLDSTV